MFIKHLYSLFDKNTFVSLLPIFLLGCLCFSNSCANILYISLTCVLFRCLYYQYILFHGFSSHYLGNVVCWTGICHFNVVHLSSFFLFMTSTLCILLKKSLSTSKSWRYSSMIYSEILPFAFRTMCHRHVQDRGSRSLLLWLLLLLYMNSPCAASTMYWESQSFSLLHGPFSYTRSPNAYWSVSGLLILFCWYACLFLPRTTLS